MLHKDILIKLIRLQNQLELIKGSGSRDPDLVEAGLCVAKTTSIQRAIDRVEEIKSMHVSIDNRTEITV